MKKVKIWHLGLIALAVIILTNITAIQARVSNPAASGESFTNIAELNSILSPESVASSSDIISFSDIAGINTLLSGETVASTTANLSTFTNDAGFYDSLTDLSLTQGYFYVGNSSNNPLATSTIFISTSSKVGISSTTPAEELTVNGQMYIDGTTSATSTIEGNILFTNGSNGCYFIYGATTTLECF